MKCVAVAILLSFAGCFPVRDSSVNEAPATDPDRLAEIVKRSARAEDWGRLYDVTTADVKTKVSRFDWVIGFSSQKIQPEGYLVKDVLSWGAYDGTVEKGDRGFAYWRYHDLHLVVPLYRERDPEGSTTWHAGIPYRE